MKIDKKKGIGCLVLVFVWLVIAIPYRCAHPIQKDTATGDIPTAEQIAKKMHWHHTFEDTTALIRIKDSLQALYPDAPQLDTVNNYIAELRTTLAQRATKQEKAFSQLKKNEDKFERTTWYKNSYFTHDASSNHLSLYIGQKENDIWLRLFISYYGSDWIFFDKVQLLIDNYSCTIPFNQYKDKDTDNSGGKVWEWIDVPVDETLITSIGTLGTADKASIRLSGKYSDERDITPTEKKAFQQVLDGYMHLLSQGNSGITPDVE
jgi:hypothetical protein